MRLGLPIEKLAVSWRAEALKIMKFIMSLKVQEELFKQSEVQITQRIHAPESHPCW